MLHNPTRLAGADLDAIGRLEQAVVAADGGRLKLEWKLLESGHHVEPLLVWEGDRLVGFCGVYTFGPAVEVTGMVEPDRRLHGVGRSLLSEARSRCRQRGCERLLLVVPRPSAGGRALALAHGGELDHSEHALVLDRPPNLPEDSTGVVRRRATPADARAVAAILEEAFGQPAPGVEEFLADDEEPTFIFELDGRPVGTVRVSYRGDGAGIYGLAVDPAHQGRGIGRQGLARLCQELMAGGVRRVSLEVETQNDRALGLYTSTGFVLVATDDYYAVPVGAPPQR